MKQTLGNIVTLAHNVTQIITWSIVLYALVPTGVNLKTDQYWQKDGSFRFWLDLAQTL